MSLVPPQSSTAPLEASFKATLHSLSLLLSFYNSLQSLNASQYVSKAPHNLTSSLRLNAKQFENAVDDIEKRVRRAIAVLERDLRKEQGISPLPVPTPAAAEEPEVIIVPKAEQAGDITAPAVPQLSTEAPIVASDATMDLDDSFLHTSLFGDSAAPSPIAISGMGLEGLDSSASGVGTSNDDFLASLTGGDSSLASMDATATSSNPSDLDAIFAMVNSFPAPQSGADISASTTVPMDMTTMGDFDLSSLGLDFSFLNGEPGQAATGDVPVGGSEGLPVGGSDTGGFGSDMIMSSEEMNDLLKSLGGGASL